MLTSSNSAIPLPLACSTAASAKTNTVRTFNWQRYFVRLDTQHFDYHAGTVNFRFLISLSMLLSLG